AVQSGHLEVGQHQVEIFVLERAQRLLAGTRGLHFIKQVALLVAFARKDQLQNVALILFIINDENLFCRHSFLRKITGAGALHLNQTKRYWQRCSIHEETKNTKDGFEPISSVLFALSVVCLNLYLLRLGAPLSLWFA